MNVTGTMESGRAGAGVAGGWPPARDFIRLALALARDMTPLARRLGWNVGNGRRAGAVRHGIFREQQIGRTGAKHMNTMKTVGASAPEMSTILSFKTAAAMEVPTQEEIAHAAYLAWEHDGRPEGRDTEYWLAAEAQLRAGGARENGRARVA